jgi:hypothetical protein
MSKIRALLDDYFRETLPPSMRRSFSVDVYREVI